MGEQSSKLDSTGLGGSVRNFVFGHNMLKRNSYANQEEDR